MSVIEVVEELMIRVPGPPARKVLREASGDDHFYGAWKGGSKAHGGGPGPAPRKATFGHPIAQTSDTGHKGGLPEARAALEDVRPQGTPAEWVGGDSDAREWRAYASNESILLTGKAYGKPNTASVTSHPGGYAEVVYYGETGDPAGMIDIRGGQIAAVSVRPTLRGQGIGVKMYDWVQDHTPIDLYDLVGKSRDFTPAGKKFAQSWLEHRVSIEERKVSSPAKGQLRLSLKEAASTSRLERAKAALERVKVAKVSPTGMRSPDEPGPREVARKDVAKALNDRMVEAGDDHYYGAWAGGKASAGGHPAGPPGGFKALLDKARHGGFTVDAYGGPPPSTGFMVSPYLSREFKKSADTMTRADIKAYIQRNGDVLHKRGHYLGGWLDGDQIYLDSVRNVATMKDAERIAKKAHQLAAWDVVNKKEVRFDEAAKPAGKPQRPPDALLHPDASDEAIDRFLAAIKASGKKS